MRLEIDNLTKKYNGKIALNGINLELKEGVYGLLGANGAGKSTLMRIICGILSPTSGEIRLNGENHISMGEEYRELLGYLPQDFGYYSSFSAKEFMLYIASLKGIEKNYANLKTKELLKTVGLSGVSNKKIRTFSGGMKQRLGIAQAVLNDPKILILDEPTAGLDPKERIHFRKLISSFAKDKIVILSREVLSHVSFKIPQNTTTAIVGPSGSGKTTICSLLARFYDIQNGEITVGGKNVKEFTCDSLLKNISMVFQNVYLFNDTIRNNILFGDPNASEEKMISVAKAARCHDFIMALPDGYDTIIGEGGSTLSGGEKQRISIARAMLKDAPIVILDEATASVDPENEHLIQQAISNLTIGKTIIVIAHRLATIENAHQILVIDGGKVTQQGTHRELIVQEGLYQRFIHIREKAEGWTIG